MDLNELQEENRHLKTLLKKKDKEIYSIQRMSRALGSTLNIDKLLRLIMNEITTLMGADRSTLFIVDHERKDIWAKIALKTEAKEIRQPIGKGISGYVAATGNVVNLRDAYHDERFDSSTDQRTGYHTRTVLCMPVFEPHAPRSENRIIAVLQVLNKRDGFFTDEDEELLTALTGQVAISISNARLYDRLENRLREIDLLHEFEQLLNGEYQLTGVFQKLIGQTVAHFRAQYGVILVPDQQNLIACIVDHQGQDYFRVTSLNEWKDIHSLIKHPLARKMAMQWDSIKKKLDAPELADASNMPVMFAKVSLPDGQSGLLSILGATVGKSQHYRDEQKILAVIAQKFSRALELEKLRDGLLKRERLSAIGQMMSTVAHDIRSPVSTIYGFVDLMEDNDTTVQERTEYAEIIRSEIKATINMITEVLDFAKGKTSILPRKVSVKNIVNRFLPRLEQMCKQNQTELVIEFNCRQLLYVDEEKLDRVFYNVSKNALEAMGVGGTLKLLVVEEAHQIVFNFHDTGPGIPDNIRHRLFDSFVTSGKESGTGLGLAIVKKIVDEHKGHVLIDSQQGNGTTFSIILPIYARNDTRTNLQSQNV